MQKMRKLVSLSGRTNFDNLNAFCPWVRLELIVTLARASRPKIKKAQLRIVQANPIWGINCRAMRGKTTPPMAEPDTHIPSAKARFFVNQVCGCGKSQWPIQESVCATHSSQGRCEKQRQSEARAYRLAQHDLIILGRKT